MEHILLSIRTSAKREKKHTQTYTTWPYNQCISMKWTWYPWLLEKTTLLSSAHFSCLSLLRKTMKPRVASCNLTHWCWIVERKCDSRGNRIHSVPFNSSCARVTYTTCSYFFIECTSSFFLSAPSTSSFPLTSLLSFCDAWWLHSRLPWSLYLQKPGYATLHTHTCK